MTGLLEGQVLDGGCDGNSARDLNMTRELLLRLTCRPLIGYSIDFVGDCD